MKKVFKRILPFILIIGLVIIDQITKWVAFANLSEGREVKIIGDFLVLQYCKNTGAAFSMFEGNKFLLIGFTSLCLLIGLILLIINKFKNPFINVAIAVVVAGGIGNLIDRILLGYVTDFIYFKTINFAIFNFADICVTLGGVFLVVYLLFFDKEKTEIKKLDKEITNEQN